ncbi:MAG TPA: AAA family ATPase [Dehalococcoidia bacterium]
MNCPSCGTANPEQARFCMSCASALARVCPTCGAAAPVEAAFCMSCGNAIAPAAADTPTRAPAPVAAPLPTSFASGRYMVRSFLGEGAKKRVYLAHDTRLDRNVAFALIKTDGLDADGVVRVRREAQAMGRLGDSAYIVTIHDTGDEAGAPFIVSQLMAGGSVEDLLANTEHHRLPPDRAMKIAEQICQALTHAHGRAIVHRDLKPGNVWLDSDGNAALGDFGLAVAIDRSRMTMQGMMVGTVAYMAPEQALGRNPDARSDLYALGAMLYEMVTGRPPFLGDDAVGVISQHINTPPVDPSWHSPECPKPLEALIVRLLAKSPDERPASAQDVAMELRRILDRSTVDTIHPRQPDTISDLRALNWGFFVGRREEMDGLKEALESALSGKGSLAMLVGEPGIGKTRLAEEFAVYAGLRGAQVLTGHCYEGEASLPYRPFVEAFRQYTRSRPDAELRAQLGPGAPEIATLVSEIRQRFPDIEAAPKLDPEAERLRLFESVSEFLHNASTAQPLVLHLDDLHWADKPSLLLLQHLAQRTARDRLLIVGAYRDIELDRTHPLSEVLGALRRLPNYRRVLLRGLPQDSVTDLLSIIDPSEEGAPARQALAAALYQETEGNPFFIREVLAHLIETGKIVHEGGRWVGKVTSVSELGIPEGVREVIGRRLTRLSDGCNRMLTLASTMTGGFSWEALKAINADVPEAQLLDLLEEALAAQLIAERKGEHAATYDFTHALIRQTLYGELSGPRRVLMHRQIGEALEQLYGAASDAHLPELAHHFYQAAPGGDVEKAVEYARRSGDRALELFAHEEAASQFELAIHALDLQSQPDARQRFDLFMSLSTAYFRSDMPEQALAAAERAIDAADARGEPEPLARAALVYADAVDRSPLWGTGAQRPVLERALEACGPVATPLRAQLLAKLSMAVVGLDDLSRNREHRLELAREARRVAEETGDARARGISLRALVVAMMGPEQLKERIPIESEMLAAAEASGDRYEIMWARLWRLTDLAQLGDMNAVKAEIPVTTALADEMREPAYSGWRPMWEGMLAQREGRFDEAERHLGEMTSIVQRVQHPNYVGSLLAQIYTLRWMQGRLDELQPALLQNVKETPDSRVIQAALAHVHSHAGRLEPAREMFEQLAANDFTDIPRDINWMVSLMLASTIARQLGDSARAALLYPMLEPYNGQEVTVGNAVIADGSASRSLGELAATMNRWDDAERHFDDACKYNDRTGARPWLAITQLSYAEMLNDRAADGDSASARKLVDAATQVFEALGMKRYLEHALALKLSLQGVSSGSIYTSIDSVARAVEHERPEITIHPAPDGTVTIMFSDIEDSTVLTERLGDQAWQDLLRKHNALIREQLKAHGGYEVKTMGDGFMVAFQSAKKGLDCAIAIQRAFADHNATAGEHVRVRVGLHAGEAIKDGDDFYGKNVILASRVAGKALGGEILVSSLVRQLVESSVDAATFAESRDVELKGLTGSHTVHAISWA